MRKLSKLGFFVKRFLPFTLKNWFSRKNLKLYFAFSQTI